MPILASPSLFCLVAFIVGYPLGFYTSMLCFLGNLLMLLRKAGMPQMNAEYLQRVALYEEFSNITYMVSIIMTRGGIFIYSPLLLSAALMLALEFKKILDIKPNAPLISNPSIKSWVVKGADHSV